MANMVDYLKWRGDIPFSVDPFNEIDNIILSELVYTDFEGIVPGPDSKQSVSIQQACGAFFERYTEEEILSKNSSTKVAPFLMHELVQSKRFENLKLTGYVNEIDETFQSQFAVVTFLLEDGTEYIAFRGTDNTIVGWKEDFNMSFLYQTPGQIQAVGYINERCKRGHKKLRIGGHSKGGNLAVYGASFCDKAIKSRIIEVYSNDGPGFCKAITLSDEYLSILPKVKSIIPESSIVGMLLENDIDHQVVKSTQTGAMQHDAMSWEVLGKRFVCVENVSESSVKLDRTLKNWVYSLDPDTREEFINILFSAIQSTGATTLDELTSSKLLMFNEVTKMLSGMPKEKQKAFRDVLVRLAYTGGENLAENMSGWISKFSSNDSRISVKKSRTN